MTIELRVAQRDASALQSSLERVAYYPRLRYMGSKYRLAPSLGAVFQSIGGTDAIDAFSGSGVVSYLLKSLGYSVTSNDFLAFPGAIARAAVVNSSVLLDSAQLEKICGPAADDRDFIQTKFDGVFFSPEDRRFLDSAWSHIDSMTGASRDIAISALVAAAARKQPRGVFTFAGRRYDDGRRDLRVSMETQFRERVADYNRAVFSNGRSDHQVYTGDVAELKGSGADIVYLDPPYAPPSDDADYMKRYHFLEGLSLYWRGVEIMEETKTKKIQKRHTPFANKRTVEDALENVFAQFRDSGAIVFSYSSNAIPDPERIIDLMSTAKPRVELHRVAHTYSFGTHRAALRRTADELIFVGRD